MFYLKQDEYLIVVDYFSKMYFIRKVPSPSSSLAVVKLLKQIFSEHGIPEKVVSDNGPHFSSQSFTEFSKSWGFEHATSSPHYPRSNGQVERTIQTVKAALTKVREARQDEYLAMLSLRNTPIDNALPSPAQLLYRRKPRDTLPKSCTGESHGTHSLRKTPGMYQ